MARKKAVRAEGDRYMLDPVRAALAREHVETMAALKDERTPEEIERKRLLMEQRREEEADRMARLAEGRKTKPVKLGKASVN